MSNILIADCECGSDTHEITAWIKDEDGFLVGSVAKCIGCENVREWT